MTKRRWLIIGLTAAILMGILIWAISTQKSGGPNPSGIASIFSNSSKSGYTPPQTAAPSSVNQSTATAIGLAPVQPLQYLTGLHAWLALESNNNRLLIIDRSGSSNSIFQLTTGSDLVSASATSDGTRLIVEQQVNSLNSFTLVNRATGSVTTLPENVVAAAWLPNGDLLYSQAANTLNLTEAAAGDLANTKKIGTVDLAYINHALYPSPDGQSVAVVDGDEESTQANLVIALKDGHVVAQTGAAGDTLWSPDSRYLFSMSNGEQLNQSNPTMVMWDAAKNTSSNIDKAWLFPKTLYTDGQNHYFGLQTGADDAGNIIWQVTLIDPTAKSQKIINYQPTLTNAFSLFAVDNQSLVAAGPNALITTALDPLLTDIRKNAQ